MGFGPCPATLKKTLCYTSWRGDEQIPADLTAWHSCRSLLYMAIWLQAHVPQVFLCFDKTKFIAWCLRRQSKGMSMELRIYGTAGHARFNLCPVAIFKKALSHISSWRSAFVPGGYLLTMTAWP